MSRKEPVSFRRLVNILKTIPGIGEVSARRLALFFVSSPRTYIEEFIGVLNDVKDKLRLCSECFNIAEGQLCAICSDPQRDDSVICVVEDVATLMALENAGVFKGKYHVLHGAISPIDGIGPEELKMEELFRRISTSNVREVIIATGTNTEGETTALYIARRLKKKGVRITRPAYGIPLGAYLKFIDARTLEEAFKRRIEI